MRTHLHLLLLACLCCAHIAFSTAKAPCDDESKHTMLLAAASLFGAGLGMEAQVYSNHLCAPPLPLPFVDH